MLFNPSCFCILKSRKDLTMTEIIAQFNETIGKIVWGTPALTLLIGTGVLLTLPVFRRSTRKIP